MLGKEDGEEEGLVVIPTDTGPLALMESKDAETMNSPFGDVVTAVLDSEVIDPLAGVNVMEFADIVAAAWKPYPVIVKVERAAGDRSEDEEAIAALRVKVVSAVIPEFCEPDELSWATT